MKKVTLKKVLDLKLSGRQLGNGDQLEIDKRIKAAWLGGNVFSVFPSQLFAAANTLAILDLSHNKLSVLPDAISSFIALERLFLQANLLQKLPLSLLKCELLTQVDLSGNPLVCADLSRTPLCSRLAVRTAVERLNDLQFVDRKVKLRLHRVSDLFSIETVSKGRWKELEISVNLTGEDWSLDALFDCLLDQMGVRRKFVVLLSSATLEPAVAMADSFFVSYVGPKYEACQCSLGIWNCSLHGNDLAVATALVSSESMERELLKGNVNPEHEFSNGRSLLETIVSAGRNEESVRQVELLLKFGARCTTRALEEAQEYSPMMQLLSNRVPEEDVTEDATKLIFESSTSMNEFSVGQRLGRKDDETFSGVCSRVFLAKFKGQTRCVLKIQNSFQGRTELHNSLLQEQFATEVLALQKLKSHPNIVPLLHHLRVRVDTVPDIDSAGLSTVLVFPLIERNLSQQIKFRKRRAQAPFWNNWEFSVIARELLEAVAFMQKSGVCHRDLKPDNILIRSLYHCAQQQRSSSHLLICDFGMSAQFSDGSMQMPFSEKGFGIGGALGFLPPEIAHATPGRGVILDFSKSDNWATGRVLHSMLSRVKPFKKKNAAEAVDEKYMELENVAAPIRDLVRGLLRCDHHARLDVAEALALVKQIPLDSCCFLDGKKFSE